MSGLLLDSSVWLATEDQEDTYHDAARELVRGAATRRRPAAALDLTLFEVANVATVRWRSTKVARRLVRLILAAADDVVRVDETLVTAAIHLSAEHQNSVYDASYVGAAQHQSRVLVCGDLRDLVRPGLAVAPDAAT